MFQMNRVGEKSTFGPSRVPVTHYGSRQTEDRCPFGVVMGRSFSSSLRTEDLMRAGIQLGPEPTIEVPESLFITAVKYTTDMPAQYDVSPDGRRFLINTLLEEDAAQSITLIVNWFKKLESSVPDPND